MKVLWSRTSGHPKCSEAADEDPEQDFVEMIPAYILCEVFISWNQVWTIAPGMAPMPAKEKTLGVRGHWGWGEVSGQK